MQLKHKSYRCGSVRTMAQAPYRITRDRAYTFAAIAGMAGEQGLDAAGTATTVRVKRNDRVFKRVGFCSRGKEPLFREVLR